MNLTSPADHWCPSCGIHLRSQDQYFDVLNHVLLPLCPVCQDKKDRGQTPDTSEPQREQPLADR